MKKTIIITFIMLVLFNHFLSFLNYRGSSSPELHKEILKYFTEADIVNGENYSRAGFGISLVRGIIFAGMTFTSLSRRLESFCARLSKNNFFLTSVYFIAIIYFIITLISLPFSFYLSYLTEHKFGFSNMTIGLWFWTRTKSFLMGLLCISIIGSSALLVIRKFKFYSVFIVPAGCLIIGLIMIILYPIVILPIFYEIKAIDNPRIEKRIIELANKSRVSVDNIYVIKESDYSKHTNAFFVGFGSSKKIFLYDTLLQNNNEAELISILAHEIGHWKYNHNLKGVFLGFLLYLTEFMAIYYCVKTLKNESESSIGEMYSPSMIPFYLLIFIIFSIIADPIENFVSRKMEMSADQYALEATGDPDAFISAEIRIAKDNRSRLNKNPLAALFRDSHPMTIDRIKIAEKYREKTKR